jgi:hypothetical protein
MARRLLTRSFKERTPKQGVPIINGIDQRSGRALQGRVSLHPIEPVLPAHGERDEHKE